MKNYLSTFLVGLCVLLAVGLTLSLTLGLSSASDYDQDCDGCEYDNYCVIPQNFVRAIFLVRGEAYQVHFIEAGTIPIHPHLCCCKGFTGFKGWYKIGHEADPDIQLCCVPIYEDSTFVAKLPHEQIFEHTVTLTSFPGSIVLTEPTVIEHTDIDGNLQQHFLIEAGTLTFRASGSSLLFYLNGVQTHMNIWHWTGATHVLHGFNIGIIDEFDLDPTQFHEVRFMKRGEILQNRFIRNGSRVGSAPHICWEDEPTFMGKWVDMNAPRVDINPVCCCSVITADMMVVAIIPSDEVLIEFEAPITPHAMFLTVVGVLGHYRNEVFTPFATVVPVLLNSTMTHWNGGAGLRHAHNFTINGASAGSLHLMPDWEPTFQIRGVA